MKLALAPWRWYRWLYDQHARSVVAGLALLIFVAIAMTTFNGRADDRRAAKQIADNADNAVTNCENANESRDASRALWFFVVDLASDGADPQEAAYLAQVREWIGQVYVEHDCSDLGRAYPLPPPPTIPTS